MARKTPKTNQGQPLIWSKTEKREATVEEQKQYLSELSNGALEKLRYMMGAENLDGDYWQANFKTFWKRFAEGGKPYRLSITIDPFILWKELVKRNMKKQ